MAHSVTIHPIDNREDYLELFLMADESEAVVRSYLHQGDAFAFHDEGNVVGACLITYPHPDEAEIKNIALKENARGKGLGKQAIHKLTGCLQSTEASKLIVGTANCSIENIIFYQKAGFRFSFIRKGFFDSYPHPFYENGIQGRDLVYFEKPL
ncbi:GNAT family N-acetyltransferase [Halobacillus litoralis]|uniref:GNAT family N-acetyltransferase n=1 Tax=Halobacillus litoralis TaxID=45668 RepID=UPI001CD560E2|nr:GNAT family N-acetyltransferase [Halobacillus litoralis]MCA0971240.1 GNAT family N-acetyltransferase [Halobacillus litoralis]